MDLFKIIEQIEKVDPEFQEKISPRRAVIKNMAGFGSKVAVAALPFALGSLFKKAYGQQSTSTIVDVLNFALTLELLDSNFYNLGLNGPTSTALKAQSNAAELAGLSTILQDEMNHVSFLKTTITQLGGTPVNYTAANFDYTGKGKFPDSLTNIQTFLLVGDTFEETAIRAYKGQATNLLRNQMVLTAALNIHSVEARHASHLRMLLRARGVNLKPWISGGNDTNNPNVAAVYGAGATADYPAESNVVQGGVTITSLTGVGGAVTTTAATEAFDEPLDKATVLAIAAPFMR
jgi:rubrerythrin